MDAAHAQASSASSSPSVPSDLTCPITFELMRDPVVTDDGHTYERGNIQQWFDMGNRTSPITGATLESTDERRGESPPRAAPADALALQRPPSARWRILQF